MKKLILISLIFTNIFVWEHAIAESLEHWGIAKDESGKIVYTERHTVYKEGGVVKTSATDYFDGNRKVIIGTLHSDYSKNARMPTYGFEDLRTGYQEGLRFANGSYVVYFKRPTEQETSKSLKDNQEIFSCQGWHYYLIENLKVLESADISLNLVLPSELDFYSFKIKQASSTQNRVTVELELSNWLLGFFAPRLQLVYDTVQKRLVEYKGVSNILDKNGERQEVTIQYEY